MNNPLTAMMGAGGGMMGNKLMDRFFRKVDGVVWDLMTGRVGVRTSDGIVTIEGEGDDSQININMFDQFGMEVPAFAQSTPLAAVNVGDLIYGEKKVIGWVIEVKENAPKDPAVAATATPSVKRFRIMTPDGTLKSWTPPKMSMLGFDSGVMVLRSLMNMLPGGSNGLSQMQGMLMPMMMMGGDGIDMDMMMPMMLMSQVGTGDGTGAMGMGNMAQMMPMMMMMNMMKGGKGGNNGGNGDDGFFGKRGR